VQYTSPGAFRANMLRCAPHARAVLSARSSLVPSRNALRAGACTLPRCPLHAPPPSAVDWAGLGHTAVAPTRRHAQCRVYASAAADDDTKYWMLTYDYGTHWGFGVALCSAQSPEGCTAGGVIL
jgi:hypothetical protein